MAATIHGAGRKTGTALDQYEYRTACEQLGLPVTTAGSMFGVCERTSQRYASGATKIPETVQILIRAYLAYGFDHVYDPHKAVMLASLRTK